MSPTKFAIRSNGAAGWSLTTPEETPFNRWRLVCRTFAEAITKMDDWILLRGQGIEPERIFNAMTGPA